MDSLKCIYNKIGSIVNYLFEKILSFIEKKLEDKYIDERIGYGISVCLYLAALTLNSYASFKLVESVYEVMAHYIAWICFLGSPVVAITRWSDVVLSMQFGFLKDELSKTSYRKKALYISVAFYQVVFRGAEIIGIILIFIAKTLIAIIWCIILRQFDLFTLFSNGIEFALKCYNYVTGILDNILEKIVKLEIRICDRITKVIDENDERRKVENVKKGIPQNFTKIDVPVNEYNERSRKLYKCLYEEKNISKAKIYLKESILAKDGEALYIYGIYLESIVGGKGKEVAYKLYQKAAIYGSIEAEIKLGIEYFEGRYVEQNRELAFKLLNHVLKNTGESHAYGYYLAYCYIYGIGTEKDQEKGVIILNEVIQNGGAPFAKACMLMAECYRYGRGVKVNKELALSLEEKAIRDDRLISDLAETLSPDLNEEKNETR